jgi:L-lysine 2,3-aminomutase
MTDKSNGILTGTDFTQTCITTYTSLKGWMNKNGFSVDPAISEVINKYPIKVGSYYINLITHEEDPIWRQAISSIKELYEYAYLEDDPLYEDTNRLTKYVGNG